MFYETMKNEELMDLLKKLLRPNPKDRLRFSSIIISGFIKGFQTIPHVLFIIFRYCLPLSFLAHLLSITRNSFIKVSGEKGLRT